MLVLAGTIFAFYSFSTIGVVVRILIAGLIFLIPLVFNKLGFTTTSRVLLSWLTPVFVMGITILDLRAGEVMSSSSMVGLRLFLLAGICFPFLIFDLSEKYLLFIGLAAPVLILVFFDPIFNLFDVTYLRNVENDKFYGFSNVRATISAIAICLSLYFLKRIVEHSEQVNANLLLQLHEKNKLIHQQARDEVNKLNLELSTNLELLKISENRYRSLFEQASDLIAVFELNGKFIDVNDSLCQASGYNRQELLTRRADDLIKPEDLKRQPLRYNDVINGQHLLSNLRIVKKSGQVIDIEANIKRIQGDKIFMIARDVTQLRAVQQQILISEANFRNAFEYSAAGMALIDMDSRWLRVNKELCHITGYTEQELLLFRVQDIIVPEEIQHSLTVQAELRTGKREHIRTQRRYVHKNGSIVWVNLNVSTVKNTDGTPLYMVAQIEDITEHKLRERELAEANKKIGELRLRALSSVMNPHFVFNVLSSIQFFIARNDRLNAINYLSMFSRLVRNILKHSANNRIRLSEEIELLHTYVDLEKMRFENKFDFTLTVPPDLETESITIPSLLIQPYVENAILHGLYNKEGQGKLHISVFTESQLLVFEITDDGIGREAAMKLRDKNFPDHKSIGMNVTKERLKLINQGHQANVEIEDLLDENGNTGTRVRVKVVFDVE